MSHTIFLTKILDQRNEFKQRVLGTVFEVIKENSGFEGKKGPVDLLLYNLYLENGLTK